jgi:hypothetical protein
MENPGILPTSEQQSSHPKTAFGRILCYQRLFGPAGLTATCGDVQDFLQEQTNKHVPYYKMGR